MKPMRKTKAESDGRKARTNMLMIALTAEKFGQSPYDYLTGSTNQVGGRLFVLHANS